MVYDADNNRWLTSQEATAQAQAAGQPGVLDRLTNLPGELAEQLKSGIADALKNIGQYLAKYIGFFFLILGILIQWVANAFLYITAWALEGSIQMLVRDMGTYDALWDAVKEGWEAIRDVGNTLFIFVLLYAAFNTVLGLKNGLDLVPRIIVVALLVNFSFLFATSVIDVSNEFASTVATELTGAKGGDFTGKLASLAGYTSLKNALSWDSLKTSINTAYTAATASNDTGNSVFSGFAEFIKLTFSSTFIFILGGFMLAVCLTLVARFVTLIVLCIVSALAFLAYLLPRFESHSREWWTTLIGQSFYAPAVLLMMLITTGIAEKSKTSIKSTMGGGVDQNLSSLFSFGLAEFFQFCVLIGLLYASMVLARKLSEAGSKAALSIGQRAQKAAAAAAFGGAGFALRGSLGRLGARVSDSEWLKKQSVKGGIWGAANRRLMGVAGRAQDSSFDFRGTGAAAALSAATGADYGSVSGAGAKGWAGVADARQKKIQERIDAVKKWDISGKDKEKALKELVASGAASSGTNYSNAKTGLTQAEQNLASAEAKLKQMQSSGVGALQIAGQAAIVQKMKDAKTAAEKAVEDAQKSSAQRIFNKQHFGVDSDERDLNYSVRYARSMATDAARMGRIKAGFGAAGAATAIAVAGVPAAAAIGTLGAGRIISGFARGHRSVRGGKKLAKHRNERFTLGTPGEKIEKKAGFLGGGYGDEATMDATEKYLKKYSDVEEKRRKIEAFENAPSLDNREKNELDRLRKDVEKFENSGKKKED